MKTYTIKLTKGQSEKLLEYCAHEIKQTNQKFVEQMAPLQNKIQELYREKVTKIAEISEIIHLINDALNNEENGTKNNKNRKKKIDKSTKSE